MSSIQEVTHAVNIRLSDDGTSVIILDQTALPNRTVYKELKTKEECWESIKLLQVRGAPAIGIFAAYAMYVIAQEPRASPSGRHGAEPGYLLPESRSGQQVL